MSVLQGVLFVLGLGLLVVGAEVLVRGASSIATSLGITPLVVGLTVVAFGTSAPELAVSLRASVTGQADLALGNVVGSNICNVLLILGLSALIGPLVVSRQMVWREVPVMMGVSLVLLVLSLDGSVSRLDGALLFAGALGYTVWTVRESRRETQRARDAAPAQAPAPRLRHPVLDVVLVAVGLGMLVLGSRWLVDGAVALARTLGLSELIIGLTVVAVGTSLPEVATSVIASLRGERDIAVGNVVGSNIFNILTVLGLSAALSPAGVPVPEAALSLDMPVMLAVTLACLPIFLSGHRIDRWEGGVFLAYYVAYTAYLVLDAQKHDALEGYSRVMAWFVLPLTALTLVVMLTHSMRSRQPRAS